MKLLKRTSTTALASYITVVGFFVLAIVLTLSGFGRSAHADIQGGRLITVHDRGTESTFITDKPTLREAFADAAITIDPKDAVEPSLDDKLVASDYQVNIYRARPVTVVDGATRTKIVTPYQSAERIAKDANITLYAEDIATLTRSSDILSDGAGLQLTIDRAISVTVDLYGKVTQLRTQGGTVGELLKEKGIELGKDDRASVSLDTPISSGYSFKVWREGKQIVTVTETINYPVRQIQDADQLIGYKQTKSPGTNGEKLVTYEVYIENGNEVSRNAIASVVTLAPIEQVEVVGAKYKGAYTTPSQNESITWDFLRSKGLSREQTAGIMGNLMQEHRFNTTGDGLAQWTGSRKQKLLSYPDPYSIDTQLQFLWDELTGPYSTVLARIRGATSVEDAVVIFQNQYERCGVCVEGSRIQFAYNILASH